ncbi:unnamed protein product, partial [Tetraodon nigroviridis]
EAARRPAACPEPGWVSSEGRQHRLWSQLLDLVPADGGSPGTLVNALAGGVMTGAEAEEDIPLGERKTVTDFCYLLDKSKQLFNGLRDLPQYGHKQWQSYFGRTFDVYTKL